MTSIPVDLVRLAAWMDDRGIGSGPLGDVELLAGGTQNVLLRFRRSDRLCVLRHPPVHKRGNSDETMRREARVLAALAGTEVPHPRLIASEADPSVLGAAFYLMEAVDGFNATLGLPEPHRSGPEFQQAMGLAMPAAIAHLGMLDPAAVGLGDLGRVDGWLERQVPRWQLQLDSYSTLDGYPGPAIAGIDAIGRWLDGHRPARMHAGVIHGDFHFANVLIAPDRGALAAVVDWELATLGDPRLDLAHLIVTWPGGPAGVTLDAPGLPSLGEVVDRYVAITGWDLDELPWFQVLACYRLGIILEGTHARACAGLAPVDVGDRLHNTASDLFRHAHELVGT